MSDYERAVAGLEKAGFKDVTRPLENECWFQETSEWLVQPIEEDGDAVVTMPLSNLLALLNPLTPEKVEKALHAATEKVLAGDLGFNPQVGFVIRAVLEDYAKAVLARLKEES